MKKVVVLGGVIGLVTAIVMMYLAVGKFPEGEPVNVMEVLFIGVGWIMAIWIASVLFGLFAGIFKSEKE